MSKKSTYEEYLARVPKEVQEEFEKIRKKELLPQLHADFPFKQIYNPDTHADRVTKLFQLIFQVEEKKELYEWLVMMADINAPEVEGIVKEDGEKKLVVEELARMAQEKEVLITMLADKYADTIRYSEQKQARDSGVEQGMEQGMKQGEARREVYLIRKKVLKGMPTSGIAEIFEMEESYVASIVDVINTNPGFTDLEVVIALSEWEQGAD